MYGYVYAYIYEYYDVLKVPESSLDPLELEWKAILSLFMWMLELHGSTSRAEGTLNP